MSAGAIFPICLCSIDVENSSVHRGYQRCLKLGGSHRMEHGKHIGKSSKLHEFPICVCLFVTPHALVTLVHIDLHFSSSIMPACRQVKQLEEEMAQTGHIPLAAQAEMLY